MMTGRNLRAPFAANRRDFLRLGGGLIAAAALPRLHGAAGDAWAEVPRILARVRPPVFPDRDFDVTRFGAKADGKTDSSEAITKAIAACSAAGGGRVVFPAGVYLTGPIHLLSHVNLRVPEGVTIRFSTDPRRYLPVVYTRYEGIECMNYSPFIYADHKQDIAVTGRGTLDGQASCDNWWGWTGSRRCAGAPGKPNSRAARKRLGEMGETDVPVSHRVFGEGSYLRPCFIQPCHSENILIEDVSIVNSPMYEINPVMCRNVTVRGVKIESRGPNNDGCDPDSSTDMLIENCSFATGDDCIAIKSGRNRDGRRVGMPSENIVVRGCHMQDGHGALTIGSETSGGIRNVFFEDCHLNSPHLNEALRFKTNAMRGGFIEHIRFRNIAIGQVADAVLQIDFQYEEGEHGPERPIVRDIDIRHVTSEKSRYALQLRGFAASHIEDVHLEDCTFRNVAQPNIVQYVDGLKLTDVTIDGKPASA
jgi:polygalacturonase